MNVFVSLGEFFLFSWLWGITWGIYHIPINIFVMFLLLKRYAKIAFARATLASFFANLFSQVVYTCFVIGVLIYLVGMQYTPKEGLSVIYPAWASFSLGFIYAGLQALFFWFLSFHFKLNVHKLFFLSLISNSITALLIYLFLPVM